MSSVVFAPRPRIEPLVRLLVRLAARGKARVRRAYAAPAYVLRGAALLSMGAL
jgi:hypothetical protein